MPYKDKEKRLVKCREYYKKHKKKLCTSQRKYYQEHKMEERKKAKERYFRNHERYLANRKKARTLPKNKEKRYAETKDWINRNKTHVILCQRNRYKTNINYRLSQLIRNSINRSLNNKKNGQKWESLLGYTVEDLIHHLESQFRDGMNWQNYGTKGWHIDHIKPISWFTFKSVHDKQLKECWSLENLQPKWSQENLSKNNRFCG